MHFKISSLLAIVALATSTHSYSNPTPEEPPAPGLTFLYTSYADCLNAIYHTQGPRGIRTTIPIVGGNFTGPRLSGKILDVGADWGVTDVQTGIFSADTRYNLQTHDGANLFLQTSGPSQPTGGLHLRVIIETGDKDYYWLNNVIAFGILSTVATSATGFTLRIDVWHMSTDYNATTFINGTTYP
ncbi:hypothetical protein LTR36_009135 [Oleoguttula mirabilis]|uniref:Uncharacterized protein n=1 Tax=Oleoguttula mirabilis TaxID=1507867 RepID=A0AAV9J6Z9_9PEZI|nr:hypothetical protein LTR36_009135 [Oleoguttula mirabilis]